MLEVCVDNVQAAVAADRAGAQRIELCAALDVGGVTPCCALIESVRSHVSRPLIVLIRPRSGNFLYDDLEREQYLASIAEAINCGVDGIAVGTLSRSDDLDCDFLKVVSDRARAGGALDLVMHRAFDFVSDQFTALEQLIELGFKRVLTSGGAEGSALENCEPLRLLQQRARGRIEIMPGGGVSAANVVSILKATGCRTIHGSFRLPSMDPTPTAFGRHSHVDARAVSRARQLLDLTAEAAEER